MSEKDLKNFKQITETEFVSLVNNYPNKLHKSVESGSSPPTFEFNDFTQGKVWPESIVFWGRENEALTEWQANEYFARL